ncbi:MAG: hypothetical protein AB1486_09280 [Planctomycetota bacterium]
MGRVVLLCAMLIALACVFPLWGQNATEGVIKGDIKPCNETRTFSGLHICENGDECFYDGWWIEEHFDRDVGDRWIKVIGWVYEWTRKARCAPYEQRYYIGIHICGKLIGASWNTWSTRCEEDPWEPKTRHWDWAYADVPEEPPQ